MKKLLVCYFHPIKIIAFRNLVCAAAIEKDKNQLSPMVFFGPSGCGKSTLLNRILEEFPDRFGFSVSHTTRSPRPGEEDGKHYHFTDLKTMKKDIAHGKFIEYAVYSGHVYGTSKRAVENVRKDGLICILDIDMNGVKSVKKTDLNPWYVFVKPPSIADLKKRLMGRKTETEESLKLRLARAKKEIEYGSTPGNADIVIVNDDLERAYQELKEFVVSKVLK